jgi:Effector-associated domain 7/Sortilin, neurotensin receptor 3,
MSPDSNPQRRIQLLRQLADAFSESELHTLCFYVGIDHENIPGDSKAERLRELIAYLERRDLFLAFADVCAKERPNIAWRSLINAAEDSPVVQTKNPSSVPRRPFKRGLTPFESEDVSIFFGRDKEIEELTRRIRQERLVIVNGLSGCGKSSLIKAGVIPNLRKAGHPVIYASVIDRVGQDVLRAARGELGSVSGFDSNTADLPAMIERVSRKDGGEPPVLVIDQFEQALRTPDDSTTREDELKYFLEDITFLLRSERQIAKVVVIIRVDWMYYLETAVREFHLNFNVPTLTYTVDYLSKASARQAIEKPLQLAGIPFDELVIDDLLEKLLGQTYEAIVGRKAIQPTQLRLVIDTLCEIAEANSNLDQAFRAENYRQAGSVENILQDYLARTLRSRPNTQQRAKAWRLLARFLNADGQTGRSLRRSEFILGTAGEETEQELQRLIGEGLIQAFEGDDETFYRLTHDYLTGAIAKYFQENPEQQNWRLAEDWLAHATLEWQQSTNTSAEVEGNPKHDAALSDGLLMEQTRYLHVYQYVDVQQINPDAQRLLLLSSLRYGHLGLGRWLNASSGADRLSAVQLVAARLASVQSDVQQSALRALKACASQLRQPANGTDLAKPTTMSALMDAPLRQDLQIALLPKTATATSTPQREAAARSLWVLRDLCTKRDLAWVIFILGRRWFARHWVQVLSYALVALLVAGSALATVYVQQRLRGTWRTHLNLFAGSVPIVFSDGTNPETIYALTQGGSQPRQGASLFRRRGTDTDGAWELVKEDFTKAQPTSMIAVKRAASEELYVTLYGEGVAHSRDAGQTWSYLNRGLYSFALTAIAADPNDPNRLFVASDDYRGVFQSVNGGESWERYDHRDEIFGAAITRLAYTSVGSGTLIAGTSDGRILIHPLEGSEWERGSNFGQGSINVISVGQAGEMVVAGTGRGYLIYSQNGGKDWNEIGQLGGEQADEYETNIVALALVPQDPRQFYATAYGNGGYTLWRIWNTGDEWKWERQEAPGLPRTHMLSLLIANQPPYRMIAGTAEGLFESEGPGAQWKMNALHAPLASLSQLAMGQQVSMPVYAVAGASVFVNANGDLQTWVRGTGLEAEAVRTLAVHPNTPTVAFAGVLILGDWSIFVTRDGGQTWTHTTPPFSASNPPDTFALALGKEATGRAILYAAPVGCGILRSDDEAASWETFGRKNCSDIAKGNMPYDVRHLAVDAKDANLVYAAAAQGFWRSRDGGKTWQPRAPREITSPIVDIQSDSVEPDAVYLISASEGFWRSNDAGETWQRDGEQALAGITPTTLTSVAGQSRQVIVGTSTGDIWTSLNGGATWNSIRENLKVGSVSSVVTSPALNGSILVGTYSDGIAVYSPGTLFEDK